MVEYAAEVEEIEFTLRQTLKTRAYWLITVGGAIAGMVSGVIIMHSIPLLTDMGLDPVGAARLTGVLIIPLPLAQFLGGFAADHVKKNNLRLILGGHFSRKLSGSPSSC